MVQAITNPADYSSKAMRELYRSTRTLAAKCGPEFLRQFQKDWGSENKFMSQFKERA